MSEARSVTLEIYVLHRGRWEIHSNFSISQREVCIEEAKTLDVSGQFSAVCVVRETYSPVDNSTREAVIYHSPKLPSAPPVAKVVSGAADGFVSEGVVRPTKKKEAPGSWKKEETAPKSSGKRTSKSRPASPAAAAKQNPKPKKRKSNISVEKALLRLGMSLAASMVVGGLLTWIVYKAIQYVPDLGYSISNEVAQVILVSTFFLSSLGVFIPRAIALWPSLTGQSETSSNQAANVPATPAAAYETPLTPSESHGDTGPASPGSTEPGPKADSASPVSDAGQATKPVAGQVDQVEISEAALAAQKASESGEAGNPDNQDNGQTPPPLVDAVDKEEAFGIPNKAKSDMSNQLLHFARDSLESLAKGKHELNAFNRFGMTLYLAGAGEYLGMQHQVPEKDKKAVLTEKATILGHKPDLARAFSANIEEYLLDPRNLEMYEAGRSTMAKYQQDPNMDVALADILDKWNRPKVEEETHAKEFVAVLFTDIVGSTALTQERGDEAAQKVVHMHNKIVREALGLHSGREIKHTGDGIMATFPQITNAVDGAIAILKSTRKENESNPELGLGICIGINAGEPIHEDGDVFGTPVQMAARVLSKAEGGEIAVSSIVKELCSGKDYVTTKKGDYDLKGFAEPVPIYLVQWDRLSGALAAPPKDESGAAETLAANDKGEAA